MENKHPLLEERFKKSEQFVSRLIAGEAVLVPMRQNVGDLDCIYSLNETAASAWELLDGNRPLRDVLASLLGEYEIGEEKATQDLLGLVDQLLGIGALEKV